ncbi:uncharacterized protein VTP21DRAFT_4986 [Calcarisporiella thermophila]|uniref:uncharacterized protein n=1 Tax=Calcarisporiella thermophila TaxID=911321 RepID=UPI0037436862
MHQDVAATNSTSLLPEKIPVDVFKGSGCGFVWDAESVKTLREEHRIVGSLCGSIARFPLQHVFMGLPLQLSPEEITLLFHRGIISLIDSHKSYQPEEDKGETATHSGSTLTLPTSSVKLPYYRPQSLQEEATKKIMEICDHNRYVVFEVLWSMGYYIGPGLKFGGDYLLYEGDPLRYHAAKIASVVEWNEEFCLRELVARARLAGGAKKTHWMCAGLAGDVHIFEIKWAGF